MNKQISVGTFDQQTFKKKFDQKCFAASLKKGIVVCLLAAALLVSMVGMASAVTYNWYLRDANYGGTVVDDTYTHECDKTMSKTPGAFSTTEQIQKPGATWRVAWWYSEVPAEFDINFGTGNWKAFVDYDNTGTDTEILYIQIFKVNAAGNAVALTEEYHATGLGTEGHYDATYTLTSTADHSISEGERFAVRFRWDKDSDDYVQIQYNNDAGTLHNTHILSPDTDPGFPVPELSTLVLFSTGLLALMGYVVYRRRTTKK